MGRIWSSSGSSSFSVSTGGRKWDDGLKLKLGPARFRDVGCCAWWLDAGLADVSKFSIEKLDFLFAICAGLASVLISWLCLLFRESVEDNEDEEEEDVDGDDEDEDDKFS